jgi:hypothetical protein
MLPDGFTRKNTPMTSPPAANAAMTVPRMSVLPV